jgi:hypothetical protein
MMNGVQKGVFVVASFEQSTTSICLFYSELAFLKALNPVG